MNINMTHCSIQFWGGCKFSTPRN